MALVPPLLLQIPALLLSRAAPGAASTEHALAWAAQCRVWGTHCMGWDPWHVGEVGAETLADMWLQSQEVLSGKGAVGKNGCLWLL